MANLTSAPNPTTQYALTLPASAFSIGFPFVNLNQNQEENEKICSY